MIMFLIIIHVIACIGLIGIVLIQRGRGSGLVESLSGVESVFGTKTSAFLTKTTTVLSIIFFLTCLSLAAFSLKQSKSLMRSVKPSAAVRTEPAKTENAEAGAVAPASSSESQATQEALAGKAREPEQK